MKRFCSLILLLSLVACGGPSSSEKGTQSGSGSTESRIGTVRLRTGPIHSDVGLSQQSVGGERYLVHHTKESLLLDDENHGSDIYFHDLQEQRCQLISRGPAGPGNGASQWATVSRDGRYVAFESTASNLVVGDTNGFKDVFLHDRQTGKTRRLSLGPGAVQANGDSYDAQVSANGNAVVFVSRATNLIASDGNGMADVFYYDIAAETLIRVSEPAGGGEVTGSDCDQPTIYEDGNFVVYVSSGTNLPGANGIPQIYATRPKTKKVWQASRNASNESANGICSAPTFGGRTHLTFTSAASNLAADDSNGVTDVFVVSKDTLLPFLASRDDGGAPLAGNSRDSVLSADGTKLVFVTETGGAAHDFGTAPRVIRRDLVGGTNTIVSEPNEFSDGVGVTESGNLVAFATITSHSTGPDTASASLFTYDVLNPGVQALKCQKCPFPLDWPGLKGSPLSLINVDDNPVAAARGDIDGDTHIDCVVVNSPAFGTDYSLSVILNDGTGKFPTSTRIALTKKPFNVALGDIDGDLDLDLAIAHRDDDSVSVFVNTGGTFSGPTFYPVGDQPRDLAFGKIDGDTDFDLVVANFGDDTVSVLTNTDGLGTYSAPVDFGVGDGPSAVRLGDIDGDTKLDIVTADSQGQTFSVLKGDGAGSFSGLSSTAAEVSGFTPLALGNIDGDTDLDVVICGNGEASIFVNTDGMGNFGAPTALDLFSTPGQAVELGDLDGDGDLDVAVTAGVVITHFVRVFRNTDGIFVQDDDYPVAQGSVDVFIDRLDTGATNDLMVVSNVLSTDGGYLSVLLNTAGTGSFEGPTVIPVFGPHQTPSFVAVGDLDGDGDGEIGFTTNNVSGTTDIHLLTNQGDESFAGPFVGFTLATNPFTLAFADIDGDCDLDALALRSSGGVLDVLKSGGGVFSLFASLTVGDLSAAVRLVDVDSDADYDLVLANTGSDNVTIFINSDGLGTFTGPTSITVADRPRALECTDLDGDDDIDLLVRHTSSESISVLLNTDGLGTYVLSGTFSLAGLANTSSLDVGDLDGDGDPDIVMGKGNGGVSLFINSGGTFSASSGPSERANHVVLGDIDGDGDRDLITTDQSATFLRVYLNSAGTFPAPLTYAVHGRLPLRPVLHDLDGDGDLDIVVASSEGSGFSIFFNRACP